MSIAAKINVLLLLLIALLSGLIWVLQQPKATHPLLPNLKPAQIERIVVLPPDNPELRLHKQSGRWVLATLDDFPANAGVIEHLVALTQAEILSEYPLPAALAAFGLDRGVGIKFNDQMVKLGKLDPVKKQRYVQIRDRLYLIFDRYSHHLKASLVSNRVVPDQGSIQQIQLPQRVLTLTEAGWQSKPTLPVKKIQNIVNLWSHAVTQKIVLLAQPPEHSNVVLKVNDRLIHYWFDAAQNTLTRLKPAIRYKLSEKLLDQLMPRPD